MTDPIEMVVVLETTPEAAFRAFVEDVGLWWPMRPFSVAEGTVRMEPGLGGRIVETGPDGAAHIWGEVTGWTLGRQIDLCWFVGQGPDNRTDLTLHFQPTDDGRTGVTLRHSGWERLSAAGQARLQNYRGGWSAIFATASADHARRLCPPSNP